MSVSRSHSSWVWAGAVGTGNQVLLEQIPTAFLGETALTCLRGSTWHLQGEPAVSSRSRVPPARTHLLQPDHWEGRWASLGGVVSSRL